MEAQVSESKVRVRCLKLDIQNQQIPASDVSLAVGIVPYIGDISEFFSNAMANTTSALVSFVSESSFYSRIRRRASFLNVRNVKFHNVDDVDRCWLEYDFGANSRQKLGTGFIDIASRINR